MPVSFKLSEEKKVSVFFEEWDQHLSFSVCLRTLIATKILERRMQLYYEEV